MSDKLTKKQLDETHAGMLLVDKNRRVYLVDRTNYGILFECTFTDLSAADISKFYEKYGLLNVSELEEIDKTFNNPAVVALRSQRNNHLTYNGHLARGNYLRVVKGPNGLPQVLPGFITVP